MELLAYTIVAGVATALTRFLAYFVFKNNNSNENLLYLQKNSGIVIMAILLVYAINSLNVSGAGLVVAVFCAILAIGLQLWRKNFLLSIALSTILYMLYMWAKAQGILDGFSGL